ncbi:MAG: hypothetical protein EA383_00925 [Spirochaetaceae bacterium]|nr:MAG: hypothetical protein EA383_00925 [Spirochaetaceae bacterium]
MHVIEKFLQSKNGDTASCEDGIFAGRNLAAIVDGATSKGTLLYDGKTPGRLARDLVLEAIEDIDSTVDPDQMDSSRVLETLNEAIAAWYRASGMYEDAQQNPELRASASLVVYCEPLRELWMVGDCRARTEYSVFGHDKRIDFLFSELRSYVIEDLLASGVTEQSLLEHDRSRELILPFLKMQHGFQNQRYRSDFSYSVLDGYFTELSNRRCIPVARSATELMLGSDGYPELERTLAESEQSLQRMLDEDPLMYRLHRSTKGVTRGNLSFDDRAFLRLAI